MDYLKYVVGDAEDLRKAQEFIETWAGDFRKAQQAVDAWVEPLRKMFESPAYKAAMREMEAMFYSLNKIDWENVAQNANRLNNYRLGAEMGRSIRNPEPFVKPRRIGFHAD